MSLQHQLQSKSKAELVEIAQALQELKNRNSTVYGLVHPEDGLKESYQWHPVDGWSVTLGMPTIFIPYRLKNFLIKDKRFKILYGGRGGAKTESVARIALARAKDRGHSFACFREFQNSIDESVHNTLAELADEIWEGKFHINKTDISCPDSGAEFAFRGLSRNITSVKGMTSYDVFWNEEAEGLKQDSVDVPAKTLRRKGSEHWYTLNPKSSSDPIAQRFIVPFQEHLDRDGYYEDDLHIIIKINWSDNPWFKDCELPADRLFDYENLPRVVYSHVWEGSFNDSIANAIIPAEWFDSCIDAHKHLGFKPTGINVVSHDPSDLGPDSKGLCHRHGSVILNVSEKLTGDVNEGFDWAMDYAIDHNADEFIWDAGGMGVSLKRQADIGFHGKRIKITMFNGAETADFPEMIYSPAEKSEFKKSKKNKDVFANKRAQYYWMLRDKVYNTYRAVVHGEYCNPDDLISFSSSITNMQKLRAEVCRLPRKPNTNNKIQMLSKQEMKKLEIDSPNLADSVMMSLAIGHKKVNKITPTTPPKRVRAR